MERPEPAEMCAPDTDDATEIDTLRQRLREVTAQRDAARLALEQSQRQNYRLACMTMNLPDPEPGYLAYTPRFPSPTRMHSVL